MDLSEPRERDRLPPAEIVVLLAMRVEVDGLRAGVDRRAEVRAILATLGCAEADLALLDFVAAIATPGAAMRPISLGGVRRPLISADERLLIDVIALQQQRRSLESMIMLRTIWHDECAALAIQEAGRRLAHLLRQAGQRLLAPEDQTRLSAWSGHAGLTASERPSPTLTSW